MIVGITIFALYAIFLGYLIFKYERPSGEKSKITGRGGDFEG